MNIETFLCPYSGSMWQPFITKQVTIALQQSNKNKEESLILTLVIMKIKKCLKINNDLRQILLSTHIEAVKLNVDINPNPRSPFFKTYLRGRVGPTPKGFSSITFEKNKLETPHFSLCSLNNIHIGRYDQI